MVRVCSDDDGNGECVALLMFGWFLYVQETEQL